MLAKPRAAAGLAALDYGSSPPALRPGVNGRRGSRAGRARRVARTDRLTIYAETGSGAPRSLRPAPQLDATDRTA